MAGKMWLTLCEMDAILSSFKNLSERILEVSDGNYVTENLFCISEGESADAMSQVLTSLVDCSQQMKEIITQTDQYLENIKEEFCTVDRQGAAMMTLGDAWKGK